MLLVLFPALTDIDLFFPSSAGCQSLHLPCLPISPLSATNSATFSRQLITLHLTTTTSHLTTSPPSLHLAHYTEYIDHGSYKATSASIEHPKEHDFPVRAPRAHLHMSRLCQTGRCQQEVRRHRHGHHPAISIHRIPQHLQSHLCQPNQLSCKLLKVHARQASPVTNLCAPERCKLPFLSLLRPLPRPPSQQQQWKWQRSLNQAYLESPAHPLTPLSEKPEQKPGPHSPSAPPSSTGATRAGSSLYTSDSLASECGQRLPLPPPAFSAALPPASAPLRLLSVSLPVSV